MSDTQQSLPRLSLCMIVKDERQNLPRCLTSVKPYVDEMIIVDTGSQDETPKIATQYGATVKTFKWIDDFAAARNYALSLVTGDWVLVLDADEELVVSSENFKTQLNLQNAILAYSIIRTEVTGQEGMTPLTTLKLFRNLPEFKYFNRFHEQLKYQNQAIPQHLIGQLETLKVLHHGNGEQQVLQKIINRNIPILENIRQEEGLSLMLLYCLAGMYGATGQTEKAQVCYAESFEQLLPNLLDGTRPQEFSFVPSLLFSLAGQTLQQKDFETVRLLCQRGLEWCPNYPPLNYIAGYTLINLGFPLGAIAYFEKCIQLGQDGSYYKGEPFEKSFVTTDPACGLGAAHIAMNCLPEAKQAFELALAFDANCLVAKQNLERLKQNY